MYLKKCPQSNDDRKLPGKLGIISPCFHIKTEEDQKPSGPQNSSTAMVRVCSKSATIDFMEFLKIKNGQHFPCFEHSISNPNLAVPVLYVKKSKSNDKKCFPEPGQHFRMFHTKTDNKKRGNRLGPKIIPPKWCAFATKVQQPI